MISHQLSVISLVLLAAIPVRAADLDEFKVKRQHVFEFTKKPTVARRGDTVIITFASKGFCDATVAIENADGRIIRHLASGVLGRNAPAPFKKNTPEQTLVWDGKDDQGRYVDDKDGVTVRVSLGLRPQFERTLKWSPYMRLSPSISPIIAATKEGVLVYNGHAFDSVRLYDHGGRYLRTVYPFPADKIGGIPDLHWYTSPQDGRKVALKEWFRQCTLLSSGTNSNHPFPGFGAQRHAHDGHGAGASHHAASGMAALNGRIALAMVYLNRLSIDGSSGGAKMLGPKTSIRLTKGGLRWRGGEDIIDVGPSSMAFSPDGRRLYLSAYQWGQNWGTGGWRFPYLHGVARIEFNGDAKLEPFAGSMTPGDSGSDAKHFNVPASVACDASGRVYVADHFNDRVQVFDSQARLLRSIPVARPSHVSIHHKADELYVFSWGLPYTRMGRTRQHDKVDPSLTRLGPLDRPKKIATYALPFCRGAHQFRVALDPWAKTPMIWVAPALHRSWRSGRELAYWDWGHAFIKLLTIRNGKLELVRDFQREARRTEVKLSAPLGSIQQIYVNPKNGRLYVSEGRAAQGFSCSALEEIDPETGAKRAVTLPFDADQIAFDINGLIYLRSRRAIVRYDPSSWREVPWDYGEELKDVGYAVSRNMGPGMRRSPRAASGISVPHWRHSPRGYFNISAKGHLVVPIRISDVETLTARGVLKNRKDTKQVYDYRSYALKLYPGRSVGGLIMVYDKHGKLLYDDAIPGLAWQFGTLIDKDDNLYALAAAARRHDGKPYFNPATCTLFKVKAKRAKVISGRHKMVPVPLKPEERPRRPADMMGGGGQRIGHQVWVQGAKWFYGGVGYNGRHGKNPDYGCDCWHCGFALDYFARSFVPEMDHYSVAVLDSSGNLILRIGKYGNVDDGVPLVREGGPPNPRSIGGDEVALFYTPYVATHTDRRLFIADPGNGRIVSVKLGYHATQTVALRDVQDQADARRD